MTNDLSQCANCVYHYTYSGMNMCKQVGDDFYLQFKVENCPYHTSITKATLISDEIYRLRAENAALRERLSKAVELPRVECIMTREWLSRELIGAIMFEWCVLYKNGGYLMAEPCLSKEAAEIRLAELKGENE